MGISGDTVDSHLTFCNEQSFTFDLLADTDNAVRMAYGAYRIESQRPGRVTYVISASGKVVGYCSSSSDMQAHAAQALEILGKLQGS